MHVHPIQFVKGIDVSRAVVMRNKRVPGQLFAYPLSVDAGTTDNTSQLFEYIKQCFHVNA